MDKAQPPRAKTVHLSQGIGAACGAHTAWASRRRTHLDLHRSRNPAEVTCLRCKATWAFTHAGDAENERNAARD